MAASSAARYTRHRLEKLDSHAWNLMTRMPWWRRVAHGTRHSGTAARNRNGTRR